MKERLSSKASTLKRIVKRDKQGIQMIDPLQIPESDTEIYGTNHSLFIEERPIRMEPLHDEQEKIIPDVFEQTGGFKIYKLFIGDFDESGNGLQRIINKLQQSQPEDVLEFHIASNGGLISELLELYNLCNTLFFGRVTTFVNHGYSAGGWAFLFGTDRCVYEHSDLMWHSYSGGAAGKRDDMITQLNHNDKRINKFLMGTLEPYFTKKELKKMNKGKDYWMGAEEALDRGLATHIMRNGAVETAQDYLEALYPKRKIAREKKEAKLIKKLTKEAKKVTKEAKKVEKKAKVKVKEEVGSSNE